MELALILTPNAGRDSLLPASKHSLFAENPHRKEKQQDNLTAKAVNPTALKLHTHLQV